MRSRPVLPLLLLPFLLTGCALVSTAPPTAQSGGAIQGMVHGGQQPIVGTHVYLYAANTTGYGGNGIAASSANASISMLTASVLINNPLNSGFDGTNYYVTTDSNGAFSVSSDYSCTAGQQLYLYAIGGNPGAGTNSAVGLSAALGDCAGLSSSTAVTINEVSTVAMAYAVAGFATDATHVSSSGTALAKQGIKNAFGTVTNLETLSTATALATTPVAHGATGTVPQATINMLANMLAACVNSSGPGSSTCTTLLSTATSTGALGGIPPTETATAEIYIAQNPGTNVTTLYGISVASPPFSPALTRAPNDFTVAISFACTVVYCYGPPTYLAIDGAGNVWGSVNASNRLSVTGPLGQPLAGTTGIMGGGLGGPRGIAIDTSGNAWVVNHPFDNVTGSLSEFSSSGAAITGSAGYTGGGLSAPNAVAVDPAGYIWTGSQGSYPGLPSLNKFNSSGTAISGSSGYTGTGGLYPRPQSVAFDTSGNAWTMGGNSLYEFSSSGTQISGSLGYTGGGMYAPFSVAFDNSGNLWLANAGVTNQASVLSEFNSSGTALSGSGYTGGGLFDSRSVAIDGAGHVWVGNQYPSVSEFNSSGVAMSGTIGYLTNYVNGEQSIAIDGSGNVWVASYNLVEAIGAAVPVVTPIVANLLPPYSAPASKP